MIRAALLLVAKDLRLFVRDRVALLLAVALPVLLVTVFGGIMANVGGGDGGMPAVDLAVLDLDGSDGSTAFVDALRDDDAVDLHLPSPGAAWTRDVLVAELSDGEFPFAVVLPAGFGEGAELELLRDPGRDLSEQLVLIAVARALFEARGEELAWDVQRRSLRAAGIPEAWMDRVDAFTAPFRAAIETLFEEADAAGYLEDARSDGGAADAAAADVDAGGGFDFGDFFTEALPITTTDVAPEGRARRLSYQVSHAVSGMTVMMLMFSLVGFARTLIEEREGGTLRRLILAPIDPRAILLGKFLGTGLLGLGLTALLFLYASLVFDLEVARRADTLLVISAATAAAVTAFALLIAAVAKTDKQADGLSTIVILVMCAAGGAWVPLMFMPSLVRTLARFTLPFWSVDAYQQAFWYDKHWTDPALAADLAVLLAIAAVLAAAATVVFRRRYLAG